MGVADKEVYRLFRADVAVCFVKAIASIKEYRCFIGLNKDTDGVPRWGVVPAIGAEENYFHQLKLTITEM